MIEGTFGINPPDAAGRVKGWVVVGKSRVDLDLAASEIPGLRADAAAIAAAFGRAVSEAGGALSPGASK